jgi:hypothetical protein
MTNFSLVHLGVCAREDALLAVQSAGPPVVRAIGPLDELDSVSRAEPEVSFGLKKIISGCPDCSAQSQN